MKRKSIADEWVVHFSHLRPEHPSRWSKQEGLHNEEMALSVARLFVSQGMIVNSICFGSEQRFSEADLHAFSVAQIATGSSSAEWAEVSQ